MQEPPKAKRPDLTRHQKGIVNRYYQHLDSITIQKLQEAVSELYLAQGDPSKSKAAERIWKRVDTALARTSASDAEVRQILDSRDITRLAALVSRLG